MQEIRQIWTEANLSGMEMIEGIAIEEETEWTPHNASKHLYIYILLNPPHPSHTSQPSHIGSYLWGRELFVTRTVDYWTDVDK